MLSSVDNPHVETCAGGGADQTAGNAAAADGVVDALKSILECSLCMGLICEPVSLPCGHSFCRLCLAKCLRRAKKLCPYCRAVCHIEAETCDENMMLKNAAMEVYKDEYLTKLAESAAERSVMSGETYPIFFYNDILTPGCKLSLHLFEPRYKIMMQRVVSGNRKFCYLPNFTNYSASVGDVALEAVLENVEFTSDGRCFVDAVISQRLVVIDHYLEEGTQGLHFCRAKVLKDDVLTAKPLADGGETDEVAIANQLILACKIITSQFVLTNSRIITRKFGPEPSTPELYSMWLLGFSRFSPIQKLEMLKLRDTISRLRYIISSFTPLLNTAAVSSAEVTADESSADVDVGDDDSDESYDSDVARVEGDGDNDDDMIDISEDL